MKRAYIIYTKMQHKKIKQNEKKDVDKVGKI